MQSEENNIDDFFRRKYNELDADVTGSKIHWQQMNHLMDTRPGVPHKRLIKKRIIRRVINYLGMAAVITTVVYFFVTHDQSGKTIGATNKEPVAKPGHPVVKNNLAFTPNKSGSTIAAAKKNNPGNLKETNKSATAFNKNEIVRETIVKEVSDTVFQKSAAANSSISSIAVVKDFYDRMKPPVQSFTIDPDRDTLLFGANGTVVTITAHSFCDNKNKMVRTAIKLELTECYKYPDMLSYDLTTTAAKEQLVTGGMLKISAIADGEQLKLFTYKTVGIKMPMEKYDPEMQLYTAVPEKRELLSGSAIASTYTKEPIKNEVGKEGAASLDWQPAGQQQAYKNLASYFERKTIKLFDLRQIIKGENEKYNAHFLIRGSDVISDEKIHELINKKYQGQFDRITFERIKKFPEEMAAKNTHVLVTKMGFVAADSVQMNFWQAASEKLVSVQDSINFVKQVNKEREQFIEKIKKDSIAYVKQKEFDKTYDFNVTGLGWINCDKLYKSYLPSIEFSINIGNDIDQFPGNYKLVFTNIKSVLAGKLENGKVSFGKVPLNEPVHVVCVAQRRGKAVACIRSMTVTADGVSALQFEEMSPAVFKEKLSSL